jgi:hypothetical protein
MYGDVCMFARSLDAVQVSLWTLLYLAGPTRRPSQNARVLLGIFVIVDRPHP